MVSRLSIGFIAVALLAQNRVPGPLVITGTSTLVFQDGSGDTITHKSAAALGASAEYSWPLPGAGGCLSVSSGGAITPGACGASNWQDNSSVLTPLNSGRVLRIPAVDTLDEFYLGGTAVGGANDTYVRANISTEGKPGGFMRIGQSATRYVVFGWFSDEGTPANASAYLSSGSNRLTLQDGTGNLLIGSGAANTHKLSLAGTQLVTGNATFGGNVLFSVNETSQVGATSSRGDIAYFRRFDSHDGVRSRVVVQNPGAGSDAGSAISVVNNAGTTVAFISYAGSLSVANTLSAVNGININGNAFTDVSRNTTTNDLTILGTCTGCAGGGYWTRSGTITYLTNTGDTVGIGTTNPGVNKLSVVGGQSSFAGHVYPGSTTTYDLGASSLRWNNSHIATLTVNQITPFSVGNSDIGGSGSQFGDVWSTTLHNNNFQLTAGTDFNLQGHLLPWTDTGHNIGSNAARWATIIASTQLAVSDGTTARFSASQGGWSVRDAGGVITSNVGSTGVYSSGGSTGQTVTFSVRDAGGGGDCSITVTGGIVTGGTC